jgi:hypothetical protein
VVRGRLGSGRCVGRRQHDEDNGDRAGGDQAPVGAATTSGDEVAVSTRTRNLMLLSQNNALRYYKTPNVSIVIIGFQTMRSCYYRILASFNQISASNTCIWDME